MYVYNMHAAAYYIFIIIIILLLRMTHGTYIHHVVCIMGGGGSVFFFFCVNCWRDRFLTEEGTPPMDHVSPNIDNTTNRRSLSLLPADIPLLLIN